ncbi:MAG: response regulator [Candidatus Marinimicrobia bacterium]|nr:response regulator [Candidatus Neomarinimicrobiota bacterium]
MAYNILVVDDSRIVRTVVSKTLHLTGIDIGEIFEAENGQEALERLENHWIDIVFADINMPVMNGEEMVEIMAQQKMLDETPVVIISTDRSVTRIEKLLSKGVRAYLNKPFTPESVRDVIIDILGQS